MPTHQRKIMLALSILSGRRTSKHLNTQDLLLLGFNGYHAVSTDLLKERAEEIIALELLGTMITEDTEGEN